MKTSVTTEKLSFLYRLAMTACFLTGCFFTVRALQPNALSTVPAAIASANAETGIGQSSKPVTQSSASDTLSYTTANIEDLKPGDLVLARDEHGKTIGWKPIKEVYRRTSYHLRHLIFESEDGTQQTLSTTDEHPFWSVTADDFVDAGDLSVGHKVTGPDGQKQILVSTEREEFPDGIPVFNFQVEDFHTYYVAADKDSDVLLVHNADCGGALPILSAADEAADRAKHNEWLKDRLAQAQKRKDELVGEQPLNAIDAMGFDEFKSSRIQAINEAIDATEGQITNNSARIDELLNQMGY